MKSRSQVRGQPIDPDHPDQGRPDRPDREDNPIGFASIACCPQAQQPVHSARPAGENRRLGRRAYGSLGPSADEVARIGVLESPAADRGVPQLLKTVNTMEVGKMPAERKTNQSRGLTAAGLIAVTAATLLMMAWAIFPTRPSPTGTFTWGGTRLPERELHCLVRSRRCSGYSTTTGRAVPTGLTINGRRPGWPRGSSRVAARITSLRAERSSHPWTGATTFATYTGNARDQHGADAVRT